MPIPSARTYVGIAKEATKGTGVAASAYIPIGRDIKVQDHVMYLDDDGLRGSMVDIYGQIAGPTYSELGINGAVFPDTFGWPLAAITGDVATTGGAAPYSHVMATKNSGDGQPTAYSITDYYGVTGGSSARRFVGCQCSGLSVKFDGEGLLGWESSWSGYASANVTNPTASFTAITPMPAWRCALTIAGATKTYLMDAQIDMKRPVSVIHTAANTQNPYAVWLGALAVGGKFTFIAEDDTELTRYLTNTQPAIVLDWSQGAAAALVEVKAQMTNCAYVVGTIERGKDFVSIPVTFRGVANSTDVGASGGYGAIKWTLQNAIAASVYV